MTTKVQLWQNGLMMGVIPQTEATELLAEGTYRVINDQAIEYIGVI
jgi:hypothetical protein